MLWGLVHFSQTGGVRSILNTGTKIDGSSYVCAHIGQSLFKLTWTCSVNSPWCNLRCSCVVDVWSDVLGRWVMVCSVFLNYNYYYMSIHESRSVLRDGSLMIKLLLNFYFSWRCDKADAFCWRGSDCSLIEKLHSDCAMYKLWEQISLQPAGWPHLENLSWKICFWCGVLPRVM